MSIFLPYLPFVTEFQVVSCCVDWLCAFTDLKQEMNIRNRDVPDNDKCLERVRSPMDSNKLKVEMETQTAVPGSPLKSKLNMAYRRSKSLGLSWNCMKSS